MKYIYHMFASNIQYVLNDIKLEIVKPHVTNYMTCSIIPSSFKEFDTQEYGVKHFLGYLINNIIKLFFWSIQFVLLIRSYIEHTVDLNEWNSFLDGGELNLNLYVLSGCNLWCHRCSIISQEVLSNTELHFRLIIRVLERMEENQN